MPVRVIRGLIVGAVNLIVHTERMRDGVRRVTEISEITGLEGDIIMTHDLFKFEFQEDIVDVENGKTEIHGIFKSSGVTPHFVERSRFYGLDKQLKEAMRGEL